ncbi:hypothetical protein [Desulfosarcina ovata]|uniref:Uncharacterized protein n=1 Tax=Desulfosarcina ovata subsp. ovata TaxID=2752305 RepID=A0A5K8A3I8_9BACT|nr:hypothetical protein [Desulfosarcina ovata]BBO87092.1 hypothetical protein DSCOOX_02720 [Desulfosarcina ovata subsp. ovata]
MFSGIQEILIILLIVLGIFMIPRMLSPRHPPQQTIVRRSGPTLSRPMRFAIVLSLLWPAAWAVCFKPWQNGLAAFSLWGIGPVVLAWSLKWVLAGKKNKR